jgi:hypothetical protein
MIIIKNLIDYKPLNLLNYFVILLLKELMNIYFVGEEEMGFMLVRDYFNYGWLWRGINLDCFIIIFIRFIHFFNHIYQNLVHRVIMVMVMIFVEW